MVAASIHSPTKYRPDIDGLRAIAVLLVVGYHAFPEIFTGGFIGVDVFFIISGFLISSIIYSNLQNLSFSFADFYARRVKRIFPALLLVLTSCALAGWFLLTPDEYKQLGKHIFGGSTFVSNFLLWRESSYFDNSAETKPLLHLWSLGIEEQFYIIWPLVLYFSWRKKLNLFLIFLLLAVSSFLLNISLIHQDPVAVFYSPFTRIWELILGAVLARLILHKQKPSPSLIAQPVFGLCLILVPALFFNKLFTFPGYWALLPTLGAMLLISSNTQSFFNKTILSNPMLVRVGLMSYPLYLWHWPLLSFLRIVKTHPTAIDCAAAVILSMALSWTTYLWLEKPIRNGFLGKKVVPVLCVIMVLVGAFGFTNFRKGGYPARFPNEAEFLTIPNPKTSAEWREHQCFMAAEDDETHFSSQCVDHNKKPLVFLWGDSHAGALYPGLKSLQENHVFGIAQFTASSCPPLLGINNTRRKGCNQINAFSIKKISELKPDLVVLHANWTLSLDPELIKFYDLSFVDRTVVAAKNAGARDVVILGPVPRWNAYLTRLLLSDREAGLRDPVPSRMTKGLDPNIFIIDKKMEAISKRLNVKYISILKVMCNDAGCLTQAPEKSHQITTYDVEHLTPAASRYLMQQISDSLLSIKEANGAL